MRGIPVSDTSSNKRHGVRITKVRILTMSSELMVILNLNFNRIIKEIFREDTKVKKCLVQKSDILTFRITYEKSCTESRAFGRQYKMSFL